MKFFGKLPMDIMITQTPSQDPSRTSKSSKTPVRDLEDGVLRRFLMLDLDETFSKASDGYYEYPDTISCSMSCPPILQEETWKIHRVFMRFLMLDLDETFRKVSYGHYVL